MKRYTQKEIESYVKNGLAVDITRAHDLAAIPERYDKVGYSTGVYGGNGLLLRGESGTLYAITRRTSALFIFG